MQDGERAVGVPHPDFAVRILTAVAVEVPTPALRAGDAPVAGLVVVLGRVLRLQGGEDLPVPLAADDVVGLERVEVVPNFLVADDVDTHAALAAGLGRLHLRILLEVEAGGEVAEAVVPPTVQDGRRLGCEDDVGHVASYTLSLVLVLPLTIWTIRAWLAR